MKTLLFSLALLASFQTNAAEQDIKYPCHSREKNCPPPPPILIPQKVYDSCADQAVGTKFTWVLNKEHRVIRGTCQRVGTIVTFVPNKNEE
nr:hypothetical protein [uncultured Undibacterium sp.]